MAAVFDCRFAWLAVAYAGLVLGAAYANRHRASSTVDEIAARDLPHNHRMVPEDLRPQQTFAGSLGFYLANRSLIEGKYVKPVKIQEKTPVHAADLAAAPDMTLGANISAVIFPLPADSKLAQLLDVATPVVLLGADPDKKTPVAVPASVLAVLCEPAEKTPPSVCYPVLGISNDKIDFVTKNQAALRLALISEQQKQVLEKGGP